MSIAIEQALDLTTLTLQKFKKDRFAMIMDLHHFPFTNMMFGPGDDYNVVNMIPGGTPFEVVWVVGKQGTGQHAGLFGSDITTVKNLSKKAKVTQRRYTTNFSYDLVEDQVNTPERLVSIVDIRDKVMYKEAAEDLEKRIALPPDDSEDVLNPNGLFYWLSIGSAGEKGFVGGNPKFLDGNADSGKGGVNLTTYPKARNWFADYDVIDDDWLDIMNEAFLELNFQSPMMVQDLQIGPMSKYKIMTTKQVIIDATRYLRKAQDNLGADLGRFHDMVAFNRVPFKRWEPLEDTTYSNIMGTDPIVGINCNNFEIQILEGWRFRRSKPKERDGQHTVVTVYMDLIYNMLMTDPQKGGFVISKV